MERLKKPRKPLVRVTDGPHEIRALTPQNRRLQCYRYANQLEENGKYIFFSYLEIHSKSGYRTSLWDP
jgi:hypothetical protein